MRNVPADAFFLYAKWKVESADEELAAKSLTGENSRLLLLSLIKPNLLLIYGGLPKLRARLTLVLGIIMILKSTALDFVSCQEVLQVAPHEEGGGLDTAGAQRRLALQERHLGTHPETDRG